jgi:hypothetical protein
MVMVIYNDLYIIMGRHRGTNTRRIYAEDVNKA